MNTTFTQKSKKERLISFFIGIHALAIVGVLFLIFTGCEKDDEPEIKYSLSVSVAPANAGTVEVSPLSSNGMYKKGTKVTLTVKSAEGHTFNAWSGDAAGSEATIEVLMDGNKNINANFDKLYSLSLNVTPANAGTVEVLPASDNGIYTEGSIVSVVATPALSYYLKEWAGDATGSTDTLEVAMNGDKTINAVFDLGVKENFNDGVANYFIDDRSGDWSVKDNAYFMTGTGADKWDYSLYNHRDFDNVEYSVDIKAVGNTATQSAVGIYFRSQDVNPQVNSYRLSMSFEGQWYLIKQVNGSYIWLKPWTASSNIKTGLDQSNNLKVICSGSSIEVFINGVSQGVFVDSEFTSGYVGLLGYDVYDKTNTFMYDNFTVKKVTSKQTKSASVSATRLVDTAGMDPRSSK